MTPEKGVNTAAGNRDQNLDLKGATTGVGVEVCLECPSDCPDCVIALLAGKSGNQAEFLRRLDVRRKSFEDIVILNPRVSNPQIDNK